MLISIGVALLILWILGVVGIYSIGWFIHILLIIAIISFLIRIIQGRNPFK
jgi:asparagine N-glycosylation enzyme membrane subunit Stt3